MAKCIYVCSRRILPPSTETLLYAICSTLTPDNISPPTPRIALNGSVAYGIMNSNKTVVEDGTSLLMGKVFNEDKGWSKPFSDFPDGSYALFRNAKEYCEIVSDAVASRTIWYYHDENAFIASTSQRAIVMFVGNFQFNESVIPWMLSTGSLGPGLSWDKRINPVPVDSSVILKKDDWTVSARSNPVAFKVVKRSNEQHRKLLEQSLKETFSSLNPDYSHWVLPLSGGYDSRGILCLLSESTDTRNLRTITWGLESSKNMKGNDAYVAEELANALHVNHKYYHTDISNEPIHIIVNRFVMSGEGRIDHLSGYMDGFKIWKTLLEDGIEGIIRGDEGFGWGQVSSEADVRSGVGCNLCADISNLQNYRKYGFSSQEMPEHLNRIDGETLATWRDRLYHEYRLPTILSALSDLKLAYVEQINPLVSRTILQRVRELPDHLRTEKALFKKIIISKSPKIDFATSEAIASRREILKQKDFVEFLKNELSSDSAKKLFSTEFLDFILMGVKSEGAQKSKASSRSLKSFIKRLFPNFLRASLKRVSPKKLDHNTLAFRVFLISRMNQVLTESANRTSS